MMKKNILRTFVVICMTTLVLSCAKTPPHIARGGDIGWSSKRADALQVNILKMSEVTATMKAMVHIEITDDETVKRAEAALVLQRPDMLRLDAMDSLADVWAETASDGKGLWLYLNPKKKLYKGKAVSKNLRRLMEFDLEVPELVSLVTGLPPVISNTSITQLGKRNENHFISGGGRYHMWTRGGTNYVSMFVRYGDTERGVNYVAMFEDYRRVDDIWFPYKIEISFPKRGTKVVIKYEEMTFGGEVDSSVFQPPVKNSVRTIDLEKADDEE